MQGQRAEARARRQFSRCPGGAIVSERATATDRVNARFWMAARVLEPVSLERKFEIMSAPEVVLEVSTLCVFEFARPYHDQFVLALPTTQWQLVRPWILPSAQRRGGHAVSRVPGSSKLRHARRHWQRRAESTLERDGATRMSSISSCPPLSAKCYPLYCPQLSFLFSRTVHDLPGRAR